MKIEKYMVGDTELGVEIKLAHMRGGVVEQHMVRLHIKGGAITFRIELDGSLNANADYGTLAIKPRAGNSVNLRIER